MSQEDDSGVASQGEGSGVKLAEKEDVEDLLGRLNLHGDETEDFIWEDEAEEKEIAAKWLAIAREPTSKLGFSQSALFADMRSAWNPAKEVVWRRLDDNLFTIQFNCLADWNKAMHEGPWLFREQALIIEEYDGFSNPRSIKLDQVTVMAQVHQLPDNYLREQVIKGICQNVGEIKKVEIKLPAGFWGVLFG
jgi:hypothetical protein